MHSSRLPLPPPQSCGCRVAVRWHVYITSGSPASNKQCPFEFRGQAGDSLHKPVDMDACTSLLVPHIIPSTSLLQSVEGGKTGLRAVVTASGQRGDPSVAARQLVARAASRRLATCSVDTRGLSRQLAVCTVTDSVTSTTLAEPPPFHGMPPLVHTQFGGDRGRGLQVPQLSARPPTTMRVGKSGAFYHRGWKTR